MSLLLGYLQALSIFKGEITNKIYFLKKEDINSIGVMSEINFIAK